MLKINVKNLEELKEKLGEAQKTMDKVLKETTVQCGLIFQREVIESTPRRTGNLAQNWRVAPNVYNNAPDLYNIDIYNQTEYAEYVNYGHRLRNGKWWEGFHFVEKTETLIIKSLDDLIQLNIENHIKTVKGIGDK